MGKYTQGKLISRIVITVCIVMIYACQVAPVKNRDGIHTEMPVHFESSREEKSALYWNDSFNSEKLHSDVISLLGKNFELGAARARVLQTAAIYGVKKAALGPSFNMKSGFGRSRVKDYSEKTTTTENSISFESALYWEADIWGKTGARKRAAAFLLEEKKMVKDQIALNLQTLLVETWITYHGATMLEAVLKKQREINSKILGLAEFRLAQGNGSSLDVLQQRSRLAAIHRKLPEVSSKKRRAAKAYAVLMGSFSGDKDGPVGRWPSVKRISSVPGPKELIDRRPDLKAALLALKAADQEVYAAIADRLPTIAIGLTVSKSGKSLSKIGRDSTLSFVSGLLLPVFDAGRLKAMVSLKRAMALENLMILKQAILVAVREVEDRLIREKALFDEDLFLKKELKIARDTVEKAKLLYLNGQESFISVFVALRELQTLQQEEIILKQNILINRARLLKSLGAKWRKNCEEL